MGSISSLFNITSSRDVPFHQPLQLQYLHHGSTKAYLCSPLFLIPFSTTKQVTIWVAPLHSFAEDLVIALIAEVFNSLSFTLKHSLKCQTTLKTSLIALSPFHCDQSILGGHAVTSEQPVFPHSDKSRYFSCSSLSIMLYATGEHM